METQTPSEQNTSGYLSDEEINRIWSEHMHDFVPEDMMNVIVESKTTEALFEYISHENPTTIKGAFYVLNGNEDKTLDCVIYDPQRNILYKRRGSAQGIFIFDTTVAGEYAIIFVNSKGAEDMTVTLALHTYEEKEEEIQWEINDDGKRSVVNPDADQAKIDVKTPVQFDAEELLGGAENLAATEDEVKSVKSQLRDIEKSVKQIQSEAKLSMMRQNGHNEDLLENQDWNFYFCMVEVFSFVCVSAYQIHHIKKLLDNKLII